MVCVSSSFMPEHLSSLRYARHTLLTSCFSHENAAHILFNGLTFYFMAPIVLSIVGNASFLGLYLGGASSLHPVRARALNHFHGRRRRALQPHEHSMAQPQPVERTSPDQRFARSERCDLLCRLIFRMRCPHRNVLLFRYRPSACMGSCDRHLPI